MLECMKILEKAEILENPTFAEHCPCLQTGHFCPPEWRIVWQSDVINQMLPYRWQRDGERYLLNKLPLIAVCHKFLEMMDLRKEFEVMKYLLFTCREQANNFSKILSS